MDGEDDRLAFLAFRKALVQNNVARSVLRDSGALRAPFRPTALFLTFGRSYEIMGAMSQRLRTACLHMLLSSVSHLAFGSEGVLEGLIQLHFPKINPLGDASNGNGARKEIPGAPEAVLAIANVPESDEESASSGNDSERQGNVVSDEEDEHEDEGDRAEERTGAHDERAPMAGKEAEDDSSVEGKKHQCKQCGKRFKTRTLLVSHENTHSGAKPYKCKYCAFASAWKNSVRAHVRRLHPTEDNSM